MPTPLTLVVAADSRCVPGCAVTVRSVLSRLEGGCGAEVFLFVHGVSNPDQRRLQATVNALGGKHQVVIVPFNPKAVAGGLARSRLISPMAYASCVLDRLLPDRVHRCIYMDCDIVATRDVGELWKTDLGGNTLAAVSDGNEGVLLEHQSRLGLKRPQYFNSGVLLVDLELWREREVSERALKVAARLGPRLILHDQDALNLALEGDWLSLDPVWNTWTIRPGLTRGDNVLFHFMGAPKPWHADYDRPFGDLFFAELDRTVFGGWRPWNPLGLGGALARLRRRIPWIPGAVRAIKARFSPPAPKGGWQPEHET